MKDVRHRHGGGDKHQQQGMGGGAAHGVVQGFEVLRVLAQPQVELSHTAKHAVDGEQADNAQGADLDQGLEGHGGDQAAVILLVGTEPIW